MSDARVTRREFTTAVVAAGALPALCASRADAGQSDESCSEKTAVDPVCPSGRMRFQLLGSSAGKPVPRPFCSCNVCEYARRHGGRDYRTRTSMNIYLPGQVLQRPKYKVDLPPDTSHHVIRHGLDDTAMEHLLFTHDHYDHCDPVYLQFRATAISGAANLRPLHVYGGKEVESLLRRRVNFDTCKIEFHRIEPEQTFTVGNQLLTPAPAMNLLARSENPANPPETGAFAVAQRSLSTSASIKFHSLQANHGSAGYLNYVVQSEGKTVLLGWDTGPWSQATWTAAAGFRFDAVYLECTVAGPRGKSLGKCHMDTEKFLAMKQKMADLKLLKEDAPFVAVHIGDNGCLNHEQLQKFWEPHGVTVGYDGLLLEI